MLPSKTISMIMLISYSRPLGQRLNTGSHSMNLNHLLGLGMEMVSMLQVDAVSISVRIVAGSQMVEIHQLSHT
jgi:hypothetical protein